MNLNGDYLSDALAAQVGGIGIAPGGNINYVTGHAVFEATHGTAPKYANLDKVNPGSVILSGEMMLRYMGWTEAADADHHGDGRRDRPEDGHLRFRAADGGRDRGQVQRVRRRPDPQPLSPAAAAAEDGVRAMSLVHAPVATARPSSCATARRRWSSAFASYNDRIPRRSRGARASASRRATGAAASAMPSSASSSTSKYVDGHRRAHARPAR